jgi:hypothetical protein
VLLKTHGQWRCERSHQLTWKLESSRGRPHHACPAPSAMRHWEAAAVWACAASSSRRTMAPAPTSAGRDVTDGAHGWGLLRSRGLGRSVIGEQGDVREEGAWGGVRSIGESSKAARERGRRGADTGQLNRERVKGIEIHLVSFTRSWCVPSGSQVGPNSPPRLMI